MKNSLEHFQQGKCLLIDKPLHWTSFQVVNTLRWAICKKFGIKKIKIGHCGTLDPLATGLLILCTGKFTKKIHTYQAQEKTYTGIITLGATTPSYDLETQIDKTYPVNHITEKFLEEKRQSFIGDILQKPPVFSALKKGGKRLYEFARAGEECIKLPQRNVYIKSFEFIKVALPEIHFKITCSKGTYIRSIANDFGKSLNSGGYLAALRRTHIGLFDIRDALSVQEFVKKVCLL